MKAMLLAAGRGQRLRPLTDHTPKPLLKVGSEALIVHHIKNLAQANIKDIVINLSHLGEKLADDLQDGSKWGVNIQYSKEDPILETGGGIKKALPLLGNDPFLVISADIFTDYPFEKLKHKVFKGLAHLVLVDNPPHHPMGDYALEQGYIAKTQGPFFNYGGIGIVHPQLFSESPEGAFPVAKLFELHIPNKRITGEYYSGIWYNIGTMDQLKEVNDRVFSR